MNSAGLGHSIVAIETPSMHAHPMPSIPPHIRNYSLGALYATKPRPPIVKPVANIASKIIGMLAMLIRGTILRAIVPINESHNACLRTGC